MILFLLALSFGNIVSSFTEDWGIAQYGLFGMPIFIGFLTYVIIKFKAFEIKMLAAEALVAGLIILLFSEFFFIGIEDPTIMILISVTVLLSTIFGMWLINSVHGIAKWQLAC